MGAPPLLGILFEVVPASDLMMHFQICALQKHACLSNTFASVAITQRRSCFTTLGRINVKKKKQLSIEHKYENQAGGIECPSA